MATPTYYEHKNEDNETVVKINKRTKKGKYYIVDSNNSDFLNSPIVLEGFDKFPTGFYRQGWGLTSAGNSILREVHKKYSKKISLTVSTISAEKLDTRGKEIKLTIPHKQLTRVGQTVRSIKQESNEAISVEVQHYLGKTFRQFKELKFTEAGYIPGRLAEILEAKKLKDKLSAEDVQALEEFIPEYLSSITGTLKAKKKLKVVFDALDAGKTIYLTKVLREFRNKLNRRVQNEQSWQDFLSEYILVLRHNYGEVLEKESVSLEGKYPDFMLVDPYGYLDIYEIKKPSTALMSFDKSRNNNYWSVELSKAIAQIENYVHQAQRHSDSLSNDIKRSKGIDVNVVRPRGYIIAGLRSELDTPKKRDDFRILSSSLKNADVILYDDLIDSLEAFIDRTVD